MQGGGGFSSSSSSSGYSRPYSSSHRSSWNDRTTTVHHYHSSPSPHNYSGSSECDCSGCEPCCKAVCCVLGCLHCPGVDKEVNRKLLFGTVALWIGIAALVSFLVVKFAFFHVSTIQLASGDMQLIDEGISPVICDSITIKSEGKRSFETYLFDSAPQIHPNSYYFQNFSTTLTIPKYQYQYIAFYFLEGTSVNLTICASSASNYYLIRGKKDLERFSDPNKCKSNCYLESKSIMSKERSHCGNSSALKLHYKVDKSDYYYNVLVGTPRATLFFEMERSQYDIRNVTAIVHHEARQVYPSWTDPSAAVVRFPPNNNSDSVILKLECNHRLLSNLIFFLIIPAGLLLFLLPIICCACKEKGIGK